MVYMITYPGDSQNFYAFTSSCRMPQLISIFDANDTIARFPVCDLEITSVPAWCSWNAITVRRTFLISTAMVGRYENVSCCLSFRCQARANISETVSA